MNILSPQQAKQLVISTQFLSHQTHSNQPLETTLSAIEQIGYIQIDTISVVERAHHHTLWARNPHYLPTQLDDLVANRSVFEYWSHAAAYLPMKNFRYTLLRKQALASGEQKHWFKRDLKLMQLVIDRITQEGPLMAKDFANTKGKLSEWQTKPSKQALENLFMEGKLMITSRKNFHKVYDLTERVLPKHIDTSTPTTEEYLRFLITSYLQANGLGLVSEMVYLLKGLKRAVNSTLKTMVESGEIVEVSVQNQTYYTLPHLLKTIDAVPHFTEVKILSPFDNFLIQRKRIKALYNFDYLLECYVPQAKRQYGYFSLPILFGHELVGRMDCKVERKTKHFNINNLVLEPHFKGDSDFIITLSQEINRFMQFNQCIDITVHKTKPATYKALLKKQLKQL